MKKGILTLILIGITSLSFSQITNSKLQNVKKEKFDTLYSKLYADGKFNGNVLVAEDGNIVFEKSYGIANEETKKKLNKNTIFELASVSKQFTAMGIVQLQKDGKLSYDDEVSKYIPELEDYEGITIKNLLTHTSGLPDYMGLASNNWDKTKIATNDDILKLFKDIKPKKDFEPNAKWDYSNTGYLILATIIERVSGKTFGEYLNEKIFKPLGMDNSFVYRRRFEPKKIDNYAQGYIYSDSLKRKILPDEMGKEFYAVYFDGIVGDGTVNSNVEDLLKWDRALYGTQLINERDKKDIFSSYKTKDGSETYYGFGWMIDSTKTYGKVISHTGGWAGYIAYIERDLDNDKTVIILQNNSNTEIPIKNTRRILYGLPVENPIELEQNILKNYAGKYSSESSKENEIIYKDGKLWVPMNPQVNLELIPVSKTKFIVDGFSPEVTYTFILNDNGEVAKYRVQQESEGIDKEAHRIE